ncbi:hypothetical protein FDH86_gp050 [Arthrobacter phage Tank]|uniref:Uncharacterized protein n=1 Tax=Arthrobacter phage Tank TaxID=1772319 RepID=A0A0U3TNA9_9CAUD|nr:hypothetical protein FDH86_gp050 [Arthrobacter phage Tank]ALY10585.1 hypothetical protein TANK_50 [Arthrobacter phage Tank]
MRVTVKALVELTVETQHPRAYTAEGLAADVGEVAIPYIMSEYGEGAVVVMTVSPVHEE